MLISMPTGTSTIFGVFQLIGVSQVVWRDVRAEVEPRTGSDVMQVPGIGVAHGRIGEAVEHSSGNRSLRSEWPIETLSADYLNNRKSAFPAGVLSSFASRVPSLSGFAELKRCSTTARYSSIVSVQS